MKPRFRNIIFDLDGTLIKSEEGLYDSITYALTRVGVEPGERRAMRRMIGPALHESFLKFYNMTAEEASRANESFVEFYDREGIYNASVYEGVEEMLRKLRDEGKTLLVVTAKPRDMAETVLRHTGIDRYFQTIIGPARSEKKTDKVTLLKEALCLLERTGKDPFLEEHTVMVGDRMFDIGAACETGIPSIAVLYGYGDREELEKAGATYIAGTPDDVITTICG